MGRQDLHGVNGCESDAAAQCDLQQQLQLPDTAASKTAPLLSIEEFRGAISRESDLGLLATLRDELIARCKELEQEPCRQETDSTTEADSDAMSDCSGADTTTEADTDTNALSSIQSLPVVFDFGLFGPRSSRTISDWSLGRELGRGRFATVYSARNQAGRSEAAKVISKKEVDAADDWANVAKEYEALRSLGPHPNIIYLTGAVQSKESIYFFMDLADGQDLFDFIKLRQQWGRPVSKEAIQGISSSVRSALAHCHEHGTCHRDLKPENIVVQQDNTAKLVDFGCACPRHQVQGPRCVGTVPFIAPECLSGQSRDGAPADVWSFGVVILEMKLGLNALSRFLGWHNRALPSFGDCGGQLTMLFADPSQGLGQIRSRLDASADREGDDVLARMLHADPLQRPAAAVLQ